MSAFQSWGIGTPRSLRAHWAWREPGLNYDGEPVMPRSEATRSGECTALNASRKIPTLSDGTLVLSELLKQRPSPQARGER
jgi:glutathione S-transferase